MKTSVNTLEFNHFVIAESLRQYDARTGTELFHFVSNLDSVRAGGLHVSLVTIESATDFHELIRELINSAREDGGLPVLHVECHGDDEALQFGDGSTMSYVQLSRLLMQLNRATNLNLVVGIAACSGGYFLRQMELGRRSPVRAMVGPSHTIQHATLLEGFKVFYRAMLDTLDIAIAEQQLCAVPFPQGTWIVQTAEAWYIEVAASHLVRQCGKIALKERAGNLHRRIASRGVFRSPNEIYQQITRGTRTMLLEHYFRRFFMVHAVPSNGQRFQWSRDTVARLMLKLRRKGTHAV